MAAGFALSLGACGGGGNHEKAVPGDTLTVYSSLPLHGAESVQAKSVENGMRLALRQANGRAGRYRIRYRALDDSTPTSNGWDPGQTAANARQAAQDRATILYLGDFDSGASAISIPILSGAGIGQVSPASGTAGLTTASDGTLPGEPEKYYPAGSRTFVRTVPNDRVQAAALVDAMRARGCAKPYVLNDDSVYGHGLAGEVVAALGRAGVKPVLQGIWRRTAGNYDSLAAGVAGSGSDCVLVSGELTGGGTRLTEALLAASPEIRLFAPDRFCSSTWANPERGGIPLDLDDRVECTAPTISPSARHLAESRFYRAYRAAYGRGTPDPHAVFGYASMSLALDAIRRAGDRGDNREAVIRALFRTRNRRSVVGVYSIDRNGDTTLGVYGLYGVEQGRIELERVVAPELAPPKPPAQ